MPKATELGSLSLKYLAVVSHRGPGVVLMGELLLSFSTHHNQEGME